MKEHIKKYFRLKMCFIMLLAFNVFCISSAYGADDSKNRPKDIYVVYDSSLSMAKKNEYSKCPWYETGYGIEILAALLENEDRLHIFFMNDSKNYFSYHEITSQSNNLHETLNSLAYTKYTHVDGLLEAMNEIKKDKTEKKQQYLIIFSDGDFNKRNGVINKRFHYYNEVEEKLKSDTDTDVKLIYVALAKNAEESVLNSTRTKLFTVKSQSGGNQIFHILTDMGDWVFDRQRLSFVETEINDTQKKLSITAELPVKRLIILGQSAADVDPDHTQEASARGNSITLEGSAFKLTKKNEIKGLSRDDLIANNKKGLADVDISEDQVEEGDSEGIVTIWKGVDGNAAPGEYVVTAPADMSIDIYVEYDIASRFVLEDSEGRQTVLDQDFFCIEGNYVLKTQLVNSLTSQPIEETAEIYDNMVVDLELHNGGTTQKITNREQEITLQEGDLQLSGNLQLKGNSPNKVKEHSKVTHRLGQIRLKSREAQFTLDIDKLDTKKADKEKPFIYVEEDGVNISDLLENVTINPVSKKQYDYKFELQDGGWIMSPSKGKSMFPGKDEVTIQLQGKKDGQLFDVSAKCSVEYVAYPQKIELKYDDFRFLNSYSMLFQSFSISPLMNGQPLEWKENADKTVTGLTQQKNDQSGEPEPEIVQPRLEFLPNEDSKPYFKTLDRSETGPLEYRLKLDKSRVFPHFWNGGEIRGNLIFTCTRYGVMSTYNKELVISFERVGLLLRWTTYVLSVMLICSILGAFIKRIRRTRFYGTSTEVFTEVNYGGGRPIPDHHLILKKHRLRNCFIFWNSKMTAVINLGGIDKIVLIRVGHGFLKIANVQELRKTNKFYDGELPLNGKIHWEDEIRLNVDYMSGTEIIIRKNGVDK